MTIQNFLNGTGTTDKGYSREDVIAMDWGTYDQCSLGVSQWMFPSDEDSNFVAGSPVLTAEDLHAIDEDKAARDGFADNIHFYLMLLHDNVGKWVVPHNHHHLRLTRAIKASSLILGPQAAAALMAFGVSTDAVNGAPINTTSTAFWLGAVDYGIDFRIKNGLRLKVTS